MLEELEILARHGSVEAKGQIVDQLTELMCVRVPTMSMKDRDAFGDVFAHLLTSASLQVRVGVSRIAATIPEVPLRLLVALARDELAVAEPVLSCSQGFGAADLEALATSLPAPHLRCIAMRPSLPESVTNRLIARGDIEMWTTLANNRGAKLSRSSLTTLAELAASDLRLRAALAGRCDLPEPILDRLWPFMSAGHRKMAISAGFTLSQAEYDVLCSDNIYVEEGMDVNGSRDLSAPDMRALVDNCAFITLAEVLAARTGYSPRFCLTTALGNYERGAVLLVRAADGDPGMLDALRKLRSRIGSRPTGERRGADRVFAAVLQSEAKAVLNSLAESFDGEAVVIQMSVVKDKAMADAA